ncbi:hypothetical protein McaMca56_003989 [Microsporum canis]
MPVSFKTKGGSKVPLGCALTRDIKTHLALRYVAGFFGAPTVTNAGGSITDMWHPSERSVPWAIFSAASFLTVIIGPIIGGVIVNYLSWQWTYWTSMILGGVVYIAAIFFLPETYRTKLLKTKAARQGLVVQNIDLASRYHVFAYLTDCYGEYSASAIAASGVLLRLFGAAFPLFASSLYGTLGIGWGTSLLGFIATGLAPLPWFFYRYGPILRKKSAYHTKLENQFE